MARHSMSLGNIAYPVNVHSSSDFSSRQHFQQGIVFIQSNIQSAESCHDGSEKIGVLLSFLEC